MNRGNRKLFGVTEYYPVYRHKVSRNHVICNQTGEQLIFRIPGRLKVVECNQSRTMFVVFYQRHVLSAELASYPRRLFGFSKREAVRFKDEKCGVGLTVSAAL